MKGVGSQLVVVLLSNARLELGLKYGVGTQAKTLSPNALLVSLMLVTHFTSKIYSFFQRKFVFGV